MEPVDKRWVGVSFLVFMATEMVLGHWMAPLVAGFVSHPFALRVEVMMMLGSYLIGGFAVGLFSPTVRILEPGIGAALSVGLTFIYALFTPVRFFSADPERLFAGAVIAFGLAMFGADSGERLAGRLGNRDSQRYSDGS